MSLAKYKIIWSVSAKDMLTAIPDRRNRKKILERVKKLGQAPDKQGKPLVGELAGCRSVRAAGLRYRVIYRIEDRKVIVFIVALGLLKEGSRKDIYSLAKRLVELGLVERSNEKPIRNQPKRPVDSDDSLFEIVGAGECGETDGSEKHDEYLWES